jgi:hypothetical protein
MGIGGGQGGGGGGGGAGIGTGISGSDELELTIDCTGPSLTGDVEADPFRILPTVE